MINVIRDHQRYNDESLKELTRKKPTSNGRSASATFFCDTIKDTSKLPSGARIYLHPGIGYEIAMMNKCGNTARMRSDNVFSYDYIDDPFYEFNPHQVAEDLDAISYWHK